MNDLRIFLCSLEKMYQERYVSFLELEKMKKTMPEVPKTREGKKIKRKIDFYFKKREKLNRKFIRLKQKEVFEVE